MELNQWQKHMNHLRDLALSGEIEARDQLLSRLIAKGLRNFSGAHLPHLEFHSISLSCFFFCGSNLSDSSFIHCDFTNSDLTNANLSYCQLSHCNFTRCRLGGCRLEQVPLLGEFHTNNFTNTVLEGMQRNMIGTPTPLPQLRP